MGPDPAWHDLKNNLKYKRSQSSPKSVRETPTPSQSRRGRGGPRQFQVFALCMRVLVNGVRQQEDHGWSFLYLLSIILEKHREPRLACAPLTVTKLISTNSRVKDTQSAEGIVVFAFVRKKQVQHTA